MPFVTLRQTRLGDIVTLTHPDTTLSFENIIRYINGLFVMRLRCVRRSSGYGGVVEQKTMTTDADDTAGAGDVILSLKGGPHCALIPASRFYCFIHPRVCRACIL
jgi:hypothetical protein